MRKILYKMEKNKIEKMINNDNIVVIYDDLVIRSLYNKTTKKSYHPKHRYEVVK